ncbi:MAG TPA: triple tyrosine motif-containing protein [Allosphingosinicella sp.]
MTVVGRALATCLLASGLCFSTPAFPLDPRRSITQYKHTRWTVDEGAPSIIGTLAQGRDGYLWIGAASGVYRFDGIRFERLAPAGLGARQGTVSALLAARDGTIWVGYAKGGLSIVHRGVLKDLPMPPFRDYVMSLTQMKDGAIWAALGRPDLPFLRFDGRRWLAVGANWGLPREYLISVLATPSGALWVSTVKSVNILEPGSRRFRRVPVEPRGHAALSQDSGGRVWMSDDEGSRIIWPDRGPALRYPTPGSNRNVGTIFDRDQNLWGTAGTKGVFRLAASRSVGGPAGKGASPVETYGEREGLTSNRTQEVFEDREGNIWVGSSAGLDRFRAANVVVEPRLMNPPMYGDVVLGASDGAVFVGGADTIYRIVPGGHPEPIVEQAGGTEAICEGPGGEIWMITADRLFRLSNGKLASTPWPHSTLVESIYDCLVDDRNVLWANAGFDGLYRYAGGKWDHPVMPSAGAFRPEQLIANSGHARLVYLGSGAVVEFGPDGHIVRKVLKPNPHRAMTIASQVAGGLLVGETSGLSLLSKGRVRSIPGARLPWARQTTGLVQTPAGQTWLIGQAQIIGLRTSEFEAALNDPAARPRPLVFSFEDGLPDIDIRTGVRAAALGGDGRIWFVTIAGTVFVDPAHLTRNRLAPPVAIHRLLASDSTYTDPKSVDLPKGTSSVEIGYTALSLSVPERVRFLYRLEGVDEDWVDPGSRREASYANLGPGLYRFQVIASNNDGVWNREGATMEFSIPPTFLQSRWFIVLCAGAALLALWAIYSIRTRQLTARVRDRLGAQLAERERIARELHDTLLQGFQGLVLRFQAIANRMAPDSALRPSIDQALERAEAVLTEGRDRVSGLRFAEEESELGEAIVEVAARLQSDPALPVTVTVEGQARMLAAMVREELLRIAEEAIRNALQHSGATRIEVALVYGRQLQLGIRDNGSGLPRDVARAGARAGHFGLIGMRERAQRAGGRLILTARPLQGTEVSVTVPGRLAYSNGRAPNGSARDEALG